MSVTVQDVQQALKAGDVKKLNKLVDELTQEPPKGSQAAPQRLGPSTYRRVPAGFNLVPPSSRGLMDPMTIPDQGLDRAEEREQLREAQETIRVLTEDRKRWPVGRPYPLPMKAVLRACDRLTADLWLVDRCIVRGGLHLFFGAPGTAKTFLALEMARRLASGADWFDGRSVVKSPVLYVDEEMGTATISQRVMRLGFHEELDVQYYDRAGLKLDQPRDVAHIVQFVREHGIKVIIFDSLIAVHGYTENSNDGVSRLRDDIRPLTKAGAAVIFLHHTAKKDWAAGVTPIASRGAGDLVGMVDMAYSIVRNKDGSLRVSAQKPRLVPADQAMDFRFRLVDSADGSRVSLEVLGDAAEPTGAGLDEQIVRVLRRLGEARSREIAAELRRRKETVADASERLVAEGRLSREVRPGRGHPVFYSLAKPEAGLAGEAPSTEGGLPASGDPGAADIPDDAG